MVEAIWCVVSDASGIGIARREGQRLAADLGFTEEDRARVGLAATELASNLAKHAPGGRLFLQQMTIGSRPAVEILSIDLGPGMMDSEACLRDGYSRAGTSGTGLGAVRRLAAEFDIYSRQGRGTVVLARIETVTASPPPSGVRWQWGAISTPAPGEIAIGDCWRIRIHDGQLSLLVADGLGHGPLAAEASTTAAQVFEKIAVGQTRTFFAAAHAAMRSTRGAAVAMATVRLSDSAMLYGGVGNISGTIQSRSGSTRGLMSHNGTVGAEMRTMQELSYEWQPSDRLIMHSDGLMTRWDLSTYPGLIDRHPAIVGAVLHRDFLRGKDDATVVVVGRAA